MEKYFDERNSIELFRFLYPKFPPGKLIRAESPDFIVKDGPGNTLGIEITHVMDRGHAEKVSSDSAENRIRQLLIWHSQINFESSSDTRLIVSLYFKKGHRLKKREILPAVGVLTKTILHKTEGKKRNESFHIHFTVPELDDLLESMTVFSFRGLKESDWSDAEPYTMSELNPVMIRDTIKHKEEKLRLYQKKMLRFYWLLLIVDTLHNGHEVETAQEELFKLPGTDFHKVFLIERREGKLYELC